MTNDFTWGMVVIGSLWAAVETWRRWQKARADKRWMAVLQAPRRKKARRK